MLYRTSNMTEMPIDVCVLMHLESFWPRQSATRGKRAFFARLADHRNRARQQDNKRGSTLRHAIDLHRS